jgi:hypothetical protein
MYKIFMLPALCAGFFAQAQTVPPPAIARAFSKQFPDAKTITWGKENAKEYEAGFLQNGRKMSANYDLAGKWKETETSLAASELPEKDKQAIQKRYPGAVVVEADKVEQAAGKIFYEATIKIKGKKKELQLSPGGVFLK